MDSISLPASYWDILIRLALATALGAAIGANREFRHSPAGFRTHALVGLGAGLLTLVGLEMQGSDPDWAAVSRVVQGIVTGVGFIGGGVILRRGTIDSSQGQQGDADESKEVHGLSTSAAIWVVAAAGVAAGAGLWRSAVTATGLALVILVAGNRIDRAIQQGRSRNGLSSK